MQETPEAGFNSGQLQEPEQLPKKEIFINSCLEH